MIVVIMQTLDNGTFERVLVVEVWTVCLKCWVFASAVKLVNVPIRLFGGGGHVRYPVTSAEHA